MAGVGGRFSGRCSWELQANRLTRLLEERRAAGGRVLDLTLSNPTRAGLEYPEGIARALARAGLPGYRPEPLGLERARQAVQAYYRDRGCQVDAGQILLTASTSEAYAFLFKLLTDPDDEVLVPRPSYPLFEFLAGLEGVAAKSYPLRYGEGWEIEVDQLAAALGPRSRAVVLVHPNNPTGSFVKRRERDALEELARECGLALVVDEVFGDYGLTGAEAQAGSFAGQAQVLTFVLSGLSKVVGLPQLKLSWVVVQGPDDVRREALARLELIGDTYLSVASPVQEALPDLLGLREQVQAQIRRRVQENHRCAQECLAGAQGARLLRCEGGWYAVLELEGVDEEELALALLQEEGVLVHPGYFFDFHQEGYVVLSLLGETGEFREGVERLLRRAL